jgi:hypothetical protein
MNKTSSFVVCTPADATDLEALIISWFGFWPVFIFGFANVVILFDQSVFMIVTSLLVVFASYYYFEVLSDGLKIERHPSFDWQLCETTQYALPDPIFVSVMLFTVIVILGVYFDKALHLRVGFVRALIIMVQISGYLVSTLISGYFTPLLLAANSAIVVLLGVVYWLVFSRFSVYVWADARDRRDQWWFRALSALLGATIADRRSLHKRLDE